MTEQQGSWRFSASPRINTYNKIFFYLFALLKPTIHLATPHYTKQFYILAAAYFLFFLGFNSIIPELPAYIRMIGGEQYLGYNIALFAFSAMLIRPISGKLSDNIGRKPVMMIGTVIGIIILTIYPQFPFVMGYLFLRLAHGTSAGFMPTAAATSVSDMVPDANMGKYMGLIGMFAGSGMALGPVIGSAIALHYGVYTVFYVASAMTLASLLFLLFVNESLPETKPFHWGLLQLNRSDVFDIKVIFPAMMMTLTIMGFGVLLTLVPDLSIHLGIKNKGTFFFISTIASILIRLILANSIDKYERTMFMKIGSLLMAISLLLLIGVHSQVLFYVLAFTTGLAAGVNSPILFAWTIDVASKQNKSRAISTLFISLELGILVGSWVAGAIFDLELQNYTLPLLVGGLGSLLAFVILLFSKKK